MPVAKKSPPVELTSRWSLILFVPKSTHILGIAKKFDPKNVNLPRGVSIGSDERPIDAAFRILAEQTHLKAASARLIDQGPNQEDWRVTYTYLVTEWAGTPVSSAYGRVYWAPTAPFLLETADDHVWAERVFTKLKRVL